MMKPNIDPNSAEWVAVESWARQRLASEFNGLKSPRLDHDLTQVLRGRIDILEALLRLPEINVEK
jgi:hypothetical protein